MTATPLGSIVRNSEELQTLTFFTPVKSGSIKNVVLPKSRSVTSSILFGSLHDPAGSSDAQPDFASSKVAGAGSVARRQRRPVTVSLMRSASSTVYLSGFGRKSPPPSEFGIGHCAHD